MEKRLTAIGYRLSAKEGWEPMVGFRLSAFGQKGRELMADNQKISYPLSAIGFGWIRWAED